MMVHWNGTLVPAEEARVSVFDAGFLYGDGIYETMRAYAGRAFAVDRHLARLQRSAELVDLRLPELARVRTAVEETLVANALDSAVVRITVTRGRLSRRMDLSSSGGSSLLVAAERLDAAHDETRRQGIAVVSSRFLRLSESPLAGVKSTNYQVSLLARNEAREAGVAEVLLPNESGDIVEAAAANVFAVEDGALVTPPLRAGILGGITREVVMEIARGRGLGITEYTLPRDRVAAADELFLTGTTIQVAPVITVDGLPIGDGRPGPLTRMLLADYLAAVTAEAKAASDRTR